MHPVAEREQEGAPRGVRAEVGEPPGVPRHAQLPFPITEFDVGDGHADPRVTSRERHAQGAADRAAPAVRTHQVACPEGFFGVLGPAQGDGDTLPVLPERRQLPPPQHRDPVPGEVVLQELLDPGLRDADLMGELGVQRAVVQRQPGEVPGRQERQRSVQDRLQPAPAVQHFRGARLEVERLGPARPAGQPLHDGGPHPDQAQFVGEQQAGRARPRDQHLEVGVHGSPYSFMPCRVMYQLCHVSSPPSIASQSRVLVSAKASTGIV